MNKFVIATAAVALLSVNLCGCGHRSWRCWNRGDSCNTCAAPVIETSGCGCGMEASPYYEGVPTYGGTTVVDPSITPVMPAPGPVVN